MRSLGDLQLLDLYKVAFLCSRKCPESAMLNSYRWAEAQREQGVCVISGYHSPVEKGVLCRLLLGSQPIIIALAQGLKKLDPAWELPIAAGRLLVVTRYADSVSHADEAKCFQRNRMMMELADEVVIAHVSAGGSLERLSSDYLGKKISRL